MTARDKVLIIILIFAVGVLAYFSYFSDSQVGDEYLKYVEVDTSNWKEFHSEDYNFSISFPRDWVIAEPSEDATHPIFNFYIRPDVPKFSAPFDVFRNVTNVSVYPYGFTERFIGTEVRFGGVWGNRTSDKSRVFILNNGDRFAAYLRFKSVPDSWTKPGFVWARLGIENVEKICMKNNEVVELEEGVECPVDEEGYRIAHTGKINKDLWPVLREIVKSIKFD